MEDIHQEFLERFGRQEDNSIVDRLLADDERLTPPTSRGTGAAGTFWTKDLPVALHRLSTTERITDDTTVLVGDFATQAGKWFRETATPAMKPGRETTPLDAGSTKPFIEFGATMFFIPGGALSEIALADPPLRVKAIKMFTEMGRMGMAEFLRTGNGNHAELDIRDTLVSLVAHDPALRQSFRAMLTADSRQLDALVEQFTNAGVGTVATGIPMASTMLPKAMRLLRQKAGRMDAETAEAFMDASTGTYLGKDGNLYRVDTD